MTNHDLVKKIIGKINPIGESNIDEQRFENLKEMCHLAEMILMDIDDLRAEFDGDRRASVKKCTDYAIKFLMSIKYGV